MTIGWTWAEGPSVGLESRVSLPSFLWVTFPDLSSSSLSSSISITALIRVGRDGPASEVDGSADSVNFELPAIDRWSPLAPVGPLEVPAGLIERRDPFLIGKTSLEVGVKVAVRAPVDRREGEA